ncbi:MAG: Uma2 family endonuclease [Phormidesmis sp.]
MATLQVKQIRVPEGQTLEIQDVSWAELEEILQDLGEKRNTRIAYSDGTLSIVAPLPEHEVDKVCIGECVKVLFDELEIDYTSYGSTTFKNQRMSKAVEPDDCFYLQYADRMAGKPRIDLAVDPPPEFAIEVDLTSKTQLNAYQGLGVAELWRYDAGRLRIDCLQNGEYVEVSESPLFPGWPIKEAVERYVRQAKATNQRKAKKAFRQWVTARIGGDDDLS